MPRSCIDVGTDIETETGLIGTRSDDGVKMVELAAFSPKASFLGIGLDHEVGRPRIVKGIIEVSSGDADGRTEQAVDVLVWLHVPPSLTLQCSDQPGVGVETCAFSVQPCMARDKCAGVRRPAMNGWRCVRSRARADLLR